MPCAKTETQFLRECAAELNQGNCIRGLNENFTSSISSGIF